MLHTVFEIIKLPKRAIGKINRTLRWSLPRYFFKQRPTTKLFHPASSLLPLSLNLVELDVTAIKTDMASEMLSMWMSHRFDLLGSGWIDCGYSDNAPGFNGHRYPSVVLERDCGEHWLSKVVPTQEMEQSRKIYSCIDNFSYQPINWHRDYKSGYSWNSKQWYYPVKLASLPGGDIKVPWELSRLQHLPRMAIFAQQFPERAEEIKCEILNQILDFFAQNPCRYGVNWMCSMDVGIRTANLALTYSLLKQQSLSFPCNFETILCNGLQSHCKFLKQNLEWHSGKTNNHYLANLAGLLFGSCLLEDGHAYYQFAKKQLFIEIKKQFYADGGNFESSTAYHRLSLEIISYCLALLIGRHEIIPPSIIEIIYRAGLFLDASITQLNTIIQIGDNDSGLFFRLSPTGHLCSANEAIQKYISLSNYKPDNMQENYPDECLNDAYPTLSVVSALFNCAPFKNAETRYPLEFSLVRQLTFNGCLSVPSINPLSPNVSSNPLPYLNYKRTITYPSTSNLTQQLSLQCFPHFGMYVFRSNHLYLAVCATPIGQKGRGGHNHNDKLSYSLIINNVVLQQDSGTFCYSASPTWRDRSRSTQSHNVIYCDTEQNKFKNLFDVYPETKCTVLSISDTHLKLCLRYRNYIQTRSWIIEPHRVIVQDNSSHCISDTESHYITEGYGKLLRTSK